MPPGSSHTPPNGTRSSLPLRTKPHHSCKAAIVRLLQDTSYFIPSRCENLEARPHLLRRAEQAILGGFFGRAEDIADRPPPDPLIVAKLKDGALPGRQTVQRSRDSRAQLPIPQLPLRIAGRTFLGDLRY